MAVFAVVSVASGAAMRAARHERDFSAAAPGVGDGGSATNTLGAEDAAAAKQAADILFGLGGLRAVGPDASNLSPGQSVVLRDRETEVRLKPGRVTVVTDSCAGGPLVKVELSVAVVSGTASVSAQDFTLLDSDGSAVHVIEACSAGFAEQAADRTMSLPAVQPSRLRYGPDPAHPVAAWQLI